MALHQHDGVIRQIRRPAAAVRELDREGFASAYVGDEEIVRVIAAIGFGNVKDRNAFAWIVVLV